MSNLNIDNNSTLTNIVNHVDTIKTYIIQQRDDLKSALQQKGINVSNYNSLNTLIGALSRSATYTIDPNSSIYNHASRSISIEGCDIADCDISKGDVLTKGGKILDLNLFYSDDLGTVFGLDWSPNGKYLALSHTQAPFVTIFKIDGEYFAKIKDFDSQITSTAYNCSFSPNSDYLSIAHTQYPYITNYKIDENDNFIKLDNPDTLPTLTANSCSWSNDGKYLCVAYSEKPFINIYEKDKEDNFIKLDDPDVSPTGVANNCCFSYDNKYLCVVHEKAPCISIYENNNGKFEIVNKFNSLKEGYGQSCGFSKDGEYLAISYSTKPYLSVYKIKEDKFIELDIDNKESLSPIRHCEFDLNSDYLMLSHNHYAGLSNYKIDKGNNTLIKMHNLVNDVSYVKTGKLSPDENYFALSCREFPRFKIYENLSKKMHPNDNPENGVYIAMEDAKKGELFKSKKIG